ncbi:hypothetical protein CEXT_118191 [Caerostris extrusa]|uniref:Uncharacterized protein n=1 Tax=Caerostris extrusa TaxID=172846 RepID=A0AAV4UK87_CAEEX|nr:hypothetical protein CEXT_118191 [Caerostris extrusa]
MGSDYENSESSSSSPTLTPPPPEEVDEWFIGNEVQPIRDEPPRAAYTHADAIDKGHEVVPIPPRRVALSDDVTLPQRMVGRGATSNASPGRPGTTRSITGPDTAAANTCSSGKNGGTSPTANTCSNRKNR